MQHLMQTIDGLDGQVDGSAFGQQIPMGGGMGGGMGGMPMGAQGGMGGMPMGGMGGMPMPAGGMLPALQHSYIYFYWGSMSPLYLYFSNFFSGDLQRRSTAEAFFLWLCCWYARVSRVDESATHRGRRLRYLAPFCFYTAGRKCPGLATAKDF